jgi:hypothetical protein
MIQIQTTDLSAWLEDICNPAIKFSFSRWGDGEWSSVLDKGKKWNCDGHRYFPDMGKQLSQVLISQPTYRLGMQSLAYRLFGKHIESFLKKHNLQNLVWHNADVFHKGAIKGKLDDIVKAVSTRQTLIVGPDHLKDLRNKSFKVWQHVVVPKKDLFLRVNQIYDQVVEKLNSTNEPTVVSLSASMPAEILLDRLHKVYGEQHTIIDFGSLWDQLVGVKSRSYMHKNSSKR